MSYCEAKIDTAINSSPQSSAFAFCTAVRLQYVCVTVKRDRVILRPEETADGLRHRDRGRGREGERERGRESGGERG